MQQKIQSIINAVDYTESCRGLQKKQIAAEIVEHYFNAENIPFSGWEVVENPVADNSEKYPVAVVICLENYKQKKAISINLTLDGKIFDINPDELCNISVSTIAKAIAHKSSNF